MASSLRSGRSDLAGAQRAEAGGERVEQRTRIEQPLDLRAAEDQDLLGGSGGHWPTVGAPPPAGKSPCGVRRIAAMPTPDEELLATLLAEEEELQFDVFSNDTALELGLRLVAAARDRGLGVTIDVRRGEQQLFHAALAGTSADNDAWVERKNRVVRRFGRSSFAVGVGLRVDGATMEEQFLLDGREFAAHGGAFPVIVRGVGPVGTVTVSGLPQEKDHRLVVEVLRTLLAPPAPAA